MDYSWTDERVEHLKALWNEGLSCSQIAAELHGVTRNAVIGKVTRLGLQKRGQGQPTSINQPRAKSRNHGGGTAQRIKHRELHVKPAGRGNALRATLAGAMVYEPAVELPADAIPLAQRRTLFELREHDCRAPLGDPQSKDFAFCGAPSLAGFSYCLPHVKRFYVAFGGSA